MEASEYVGKYIFIYAHGVDKRPIYIRNEVLYATGVRGDRQILVEGVGGHAATIKFTRVGEHIAKVCDSLPEALAFFEALDRLKEAVRALEINFISPPAAPTAEHTLVRKPEV